MKKMNWDYTLNPVTEIAITTSPVVPDQSQTVRRIIERFAMGSTEDAGTRRISFHESIIPPNSAVDSQVVESAFQQPTIQGDKLDQLQQVKNMSRNLKSKEKEIQRQSELVNTETKKTPDDSQPSAIPTL